MMSRPTSLVSILSTSRWLAGPIFDKELRVASRRRRSYLLRFVYVSLLTVLMACIWFDLVYPGGPGSVVYQSSRLGVAGRYLAIAIVWFQFVVAQIAAPVLLGDAIRSEVRKRTLLILAVTPLGGMQIVVGKLAGGLLPLVMLLATSLPLLALFRVFGGVSWDFLVSGIGITFSAMVFAGALHLLVSAGQRSVLGNLGPALWYCLLGRIPDGFITWFALSRPAVGAIGGPVLLLANPTNVLLARTRDMLAARPGTGLPAWWPLHCLIWLAASVLVLWLTARRVRKVVAEAVSDRTPASKVYRLGVWVGKKGIRANSPIGPCPRRTTSIKRVDGSPVLWKELRTFSIRQSRHPLAKYGAPAILVCLIGALMGVGIFGLRSTTVVIAGSMVLLALGLHIGAAVSLSAVAATMIPTEREARTLPVLLTTTLEDGRIVRDKALAVFRQSLPMLVLLFTLLLFSSAGVVASVPNKVRPLLLVYGAGVYLVGLSGILPLFAGLGLYCGVRLKTATAARGCTFAAVLLGATAFCFAAIALIYSIVRSRSPAWLMLSLVTLGAAVICAGVGLILLWAAARRLRRNIF